MNRLLVIIAMLFGIAAVAGPAVAAASISAPAVTVQAMVDAGLAEACAETHPVLPKLVFKPCPNKDKGGITVFCHQCLAVMPAAEDGPAPSTTSTAPIVWSADGTPNRPVDRQFRPPRLFGNA